MAHPGPNGKGKVGKVGLAKVEEDVGPFKVRAEAFTVEAGGSFDKTGVKAKANASLVKCQMEAYGLLGVQTGLSADNKLKAEVWPPQVGAFICGTGVETGWKKTKITILGNGFTLRNPFAARKSLTKE